MHIMSVDEYEVKSIKIKNKYIFFKLDQEVTMEDISNELVKSFRSSNVLKDLKM